MIVDIKDLDYQMVISNGDKNFDLFDGRIVIEAEKFTLFFSLRGRE